ncbi:MAG TPA: serine/threonine-protein kinase, partial [Gemmatimonadaceae bacterium]|nr:serine/threonine-protein kinase [Gemmatimonadaceae bacterium]
MTEQGTLDRLQRALRDRYVVERELGRGGMATVYLAHDMKHQRAVAIKVLKEELGAVLGAERFLREITVTAQLHHPHILPLYDSGDADGRLFYVMPFVAGESLRDRLRREPNNRLPVADAVRIASQVADALDFAHRHAVIHRDVKPENILLEDGHAVVADFGIARALRLAGAVTLTETGSNIGTPAYMSPEQLMADPQVDGRSDIYSLGCVVYEMLTGQLPFMGSAGAPELMPRLVRTPDRAQSLRSDIPGAVDAAVRKALEPKPSDRFASAAEFRDAIAASSAPYARFNWRLRPALAVAGVLLMMAAVTFLSPSRGGEVPIQSNVIGVLPFELGVADSQLDFMREGMGILLEHRLNGDAGTRVAPSRNILSVLRKLGHNESDNLRDDEALEVGQRAGVGFVLRGSVVGNSRRIEIAASLLSVPDGEVRARVRVGGHADSVEALADTIASALLSRTAGEEEQRLPSLKRVPIQALLPYLAGQKEVHRGRFANAVEQYKRALEIDSTFAMAAIGYVVASDYLTVGAEGPERA